MLVLPRDHASSIAGKDLEGKCQAVGSSDQTDAHLLAIHALIAALRLRRSLVSSRALTLPLFTIHKKSWLGNYARAVGNPLEGRFAKRRLRRM